MRRFLKIATELMAVLISFLILACPLRGQDREEGWWSFRPLTRPLIPSVQDKSWIRTPIDSFVLAKLESKGLRPAPAADRTTLIRRVTYDLHGGIKGGVSYGESDEWSYKAAKNPTYCYDLHATVLHLLGIDHEKLIFRHNGIDRRLTDVHGEVIGKILA